MFTVTFVYRGRQYRDICEWSEKLGARDKARQLRKIFSEVRVVPTKAAADLKPYLLG